MKVCTTFYRRLTLYECHTDPNVEVGTLPESRRCEVVEAAQFAEHLAMRPTLSRSEFDARRARGDVCMGVWDSGQLVHAGWVTTGPGPAEIRYLRSMMQLGMGCAYTYDIYTTPERRDEGLARFRDRHTRIRFARAGYPKMQTLIAPENAAGLAAIAQAGYREVGTYRLVRLGPLQVQLTPRTATSLPPLRAL